MGGSGAFGLRYLPMSPRKAWYSRRRASLFIDGSVVVVAGQIRLIALASRIRARSETELVPP